MNDPSSSIQEARKQKLKQNVRTLFDLQWLREETAALLLSRLPSNQASPWEALRQWDQLCREDPYVFFAYQLLTTYAAARQDVADDVDAQLPIENLMEALDTHLSTFSNHNGGKTWQAVSARDDADRRTQAWQMSARAIFNKCRTNSTLKDFFQLLNTISILNDVIHGKARLHGLEYHQQLAQQKAQPQQDPVDAFCQRLTDIVDAAAQMNGQTMTTNAKGRPDKYTFQMDARKFSSMMQELKTTYWHLLKGYLGDRNASGACQLSLVCPFLGHILDTHLISCAKMQKRDLEKLLAQFYPGQTSIVNNLSGTPKDQHAEALFRTAETLLEERS